VSSNDASTSAMRMSFYGDAHRRVELADGAVA
jgi:hypothetical protein